jgi:sulfatase maturation enzyme AslB (radical SAM superfamily)
MHGPQMLINPKTFCVGPYTELRINGDGSYNYCHFARGNGSSSERIDKMSINDYFAGIGTVGHVRKTLEAGGEVSRCQGCYDAEHQQILSVRQRRNLQAAIFPNDDFLPSTSEFLAQQSWRDMPPRFYHVSFSNLCNLACMMCAPECSTRLDRDWRNAGIISTPPLHHDWTKTKAWDEFCQHLLSNSHVVCLHIMGGEPLYHKRFEELIDILIANNHTDFHFTFVTNGTIYRESLIEKLQRFRSVAIEISIEGVGLDNQYIRYHSDTNDTLQNIKQFCKNESETFTVVLRTVPQALSVMGYHDLLDFAVQNQLCVDSNVMTRPDFLRANILPDEIKQIAIHNLQRFITATPNQDLGSINLRNPSRLAQNISMNAQFVIKQLNAPCDDVMSKRRQFIDFCNRLDQSRSLDLRACVPGLSAFLGTYDYAKK